MKDTLKMQEVHSAVGIKKLIDYFNEKYTGKREYICKDLKSSIIKKIELEKMLKPEIAIEGESFFYWKINNINIENLEAVINTFYNGSLAVSEKDIIIKGEMNEDKTETYFIFDTPFIKIKDILIMCAPCEEMEEGVTLQLSIIKNSISLPKLEYPKNKMDMYRAYNFIDTVANYTDDENLWEYIGNFTIPFPENIDEANLYFESDFLSQNMFFPKNSYFLTKKDNYYTALDAIKKGKTIYIDSKNILPYWTINKEEKRITLQNLHNGISITLFENGLGEPPK